MVFTHVYTQLYIYIYLCVCVRVSLSLSLALPPQSWHQLKGTLIPCASSRSIRSLSMEVALLPHPEFVGSYNGEHHPNTSYSSQRWGVESTNSSNKHISESTLLSNPTCILKTIPSTKSGINNHPTMNKNINKSCTVSTIFQWNAVTH